MSRNDPYYEVEVTEREPNPNNWINYLQFAWGKPLRWVSFYKFAFSSTPCYFNGGQRCKLGNA